MIKELYDCIAAVPGVSAVFDTKVPDAYRLNTPVVVVSNISDVPTTEISGTIDCIDTRITCEVQALKLGDARTIKQRLIAALNGWSGGPIGVVVFESGGPELYDGTIVPPRYCLPVDFTVTT